MPTAMPESIATSITIASHSNGPVPATMGQVNEFLIFCLGTEEYGIDILRVQEIRSYEDPIRMANSPDFIRGVINLRGVIVPIIDLRMRFNLHDVQYNEFTVTIVLSLGTQVVGMVVDAVSDVVTLSNEQMRQVPEFNASVDSDYIHAMGVIDERMLILIDIVKLMSSADVGGRTEWPTASTSLS